MLGDKEITLESGKVARQATGAVIATCEDTQVLATALIEVGDPIAKAT